MDKMIEIQIESEVAALLAKIATLKAHMTPGSDESKYAEMLFKGINKAHESVQCAKELGI